jgi:hypothetical protein
MENMERFLERSLPETLEHIDSMGQFATSRRASVFAMKGEKDFEIGLGDAHGTAEAVDRKPTGRDPAANRPHRHIKPLGDVGDGVESCGRAA